MNGRWYTGRLKTMPEGPIVWHRATPWARTATIGSQVVATLRRRFPSDPQWCVNISGWDHWAPPNGIRTRWQFTSPIAFKHVADARRHVEAVLADGIARRGHPVETTDGFVQVGDCNKEGCRENPRQP